MSTVRAPGLGPIVGHTTPTSARLWIRAADPGDRGVELDSERRTIGIAAVIAEAGAALAKPRAYYFRLHREFDRTGTFHLGAAGGAFHGEPAVPLKPASEYVVRLGTLTLDDPFSDDAEVADDELSAKLPPANVWIEELKGLRRDSSEAAFRTFPEASDGAAATMSFIMGSCRYPGLLFKVKHADRIFKPLLAEAERARSGTVPSFVLMTGDQIYADMFHRRVPIGRADTYAEFQERYLSAFGSPNMRRLLRRVPSYMILDDHEIEDNWRQDRIEREAKYRLFTIAIDAYMSYQWSHGPRSFGRRLYYTFQASGYPFFVLDTRTQRYMDDDEDELVDNHLLGRPSPGDSAPAQIDRLLAWLRAQPKNLPKFIVTSSVFVPNLMSARAGKSKRRKERSDSWPAFPTTRRAILDCIVAERIQNVIFLSGDIHCANIAEISFDGIGEALRAFSITSSAFYWPFPFADGDPANFVHDSRAKGQQDPFEVRDGIVMHYKSRNFTQEDNFSRLDLDREKAQLTVRTFDQDGEIVRHEHKAGRLEARLKLHPW